MTKGKDDLEQTKYQTKLKVGGKTDEQTVQQASPRVRIGITNGDTPYSSNFCHFFSVTEYFFENIFCV